MSSASSPSPQRQELVALRLRLAGTAGELARELEAGRASAPFQEAFAGLSQLDAQIPVRAVVMGSSPEAVYAVLSELVGQDYNVCKVVVPSRLGFSEVLLQERGFLLDTGAGPQEFEDPGSFLDALQRTHALQQDDREANPEPLRLQLKGPAHLNGLCLLVPHSLDALHRKPALLSTLADQADWVFLAGDDQTSFTADQRTTVQLVLDHVTGLQNVLHAGEGRPLPATEWWKGWKVTLGLGLVRTGSDLFRNRLSLLTAPASELRHYLVESRRWRQLEMNLALMDEELQQAQRQLANRLSLAREGLVDRDGQQELRRTAESIRTRVADELDSLLKAAERDAKAGLQADGESARRLREAAASLSVGDIDQTEGETTVKLTLSSAATARLSGSVLELARQRLAADYRQLQEGLECTIRDARQALEAATGARPILSAELPDETSLWETISQLARPEIRYRGEMARATLATRFSAARQVIMGTMILGTILGGTAALTGDASGGNTLRTSLYALMLPLLVVGFLWTYVSFRKKEALILEKEVEKLHDGVLNELRRVLQELHREQMSILGGAVQKVVRAVQQQLEGALDKLDKQRQREAEEARRRQAEQQRSLEQRLARLRQFSSQVATLQAGLRDAERLRGQWLNGWIERFNQGKT